MTRAFGDGQSSLWELNGLTRTGQFSRHSSCSLADKDYLAWS